MFDPKILVTPQRVLINAASGNLNKILIDENNTIVKSIKDNTSYHNTIALVDNIDKDGVVIRENREVMYDRIDINTYINRVAKKHREDDGDISHLLLTDHVTETMRNVDNIQLAQVLKDVYQLPIDDHDLVSRQVNDLKPMTTAFGKVLSKVNCTIRDGLVTYRGGTIPLPTINMEYNIPAKIVTGDIQPGLSIIREWTHGEKLEFNLPDMSVSDDWRIYIESIDAVDYNGPGKLWCTLALNVEYNAWEVYMDGQVCGHFDATDANAIVLTATGGKLKLTGKVNETINVDLTSVENILTTSGGLQRITVFTKNPARQEIQFNMSAKKPAKTYKALVDAPSELVGAEFLYGKYRNDPANSECYFQTTNPKFANRMLTGVAWDIGSVDTFDVRMFNRDGEGGDYSGLNQLGRGSYLLVTDKNNYIEKVKAAILTNFSTPDVVGISLHEFNESNRSNAYVNSDKFEDNARENIGFPSFKLMVDKKTNKVNYEIMYTPAAYPGEPLLTRTGMVTDNLDTFENPIVLLVSVMDVGYAMDLFNFGITADPLPPVQVNVQDMNINNIISAAPQSNALTGSLSLPVALSNIICVGYNETRKNTFKSEVKAVSTGIGSITKLIRLSSVEEFVLNINVATWGDLVRNLNIRQTYMEVVNVANVTDRFKIQIDVLNIENVIVTTYVNDMLTNTKELVIDNATNFKLVIKPTEMYLEYNDNAKTYHPTHNYAGINTTKRYRVEFGVKVAKRSTLPQLTVKQTISTPA